ncbi:hypothetical protein EDB19DRAFT_1918311 [Suillus lakei]|nr:hypothetical protein EDB19DRAFT_1918311 [Suillus lakei]
MGIDISKGTHSFIITQKKTKIPAAQWTTKEQYKWLQEQLLEYIALHSEDKDYMHFWAKTIFIEEQQAAELAAEKMCKVTWFHWWTNASKKICGLKKEISVFETALLPKLHAESVEEIYMDMVYDEWIKPLVKAEQEAGNVATAGHHMTLGRKISKELLEDESDEVKKEDNMFLVAYQQYAELIFPPNKRNPLLPDVEDNGEIKELEGCNNGEELKDAEELAEDGEENDEGQHGDSIDWDNTGFASSSTGISDASPLGELNQSAFYSEAQPDASFRQAQPDASLEHAWHNIATMPPNPISMLQSSVPASSFLSSPISAEHSTTTTTEQDEALPQFTCQLPILPAANAPSPIEGTQDLANTDTGAGLAKSKCKLKLKPLATKVKCNPAMEPTPTITPTNTAKPKAKPKERPVAKSGVITETSHTAADEGNTLVHSTAINTTTAKQNPNDVADTIGSDGLTFVGIGKENPSVLEDVGATFKLTKCPTNSTMEGMIPAKKRQMKA